MITLLLALAGFQFRNAEIHFTSATAHKVQLVGDLTGWTRPMSMQKSGDNWTLRFRMPIDSRAEYKLIVDGKTMVNPDEPRKADDSPHGLCSVYQGLHYRSLPQDAPPAHPLTRTTVNLEGRDIVFYTPQDPNGKPILVVMDGFSYETQAHIQNVVANLVDSQVMRPIVLVLMPPFITDKENGPGWASYGHFLLNDVLPAVRAKTGAGDKPEDLTIAGRGVNGLAALRLAEQFSDRIGGVACQSADFEMVPQGQLAATNLLRLAPTARIWLDWGRLEEGIPAREALAQDLVSANRVFGSQITNEGYNWTAWRHRLPAALKYLFPLGSNP